MERQFKIFDNNISNSPTVIIHDNNTDFVYKLWIHKPQDEDSVEKKALDYENEIYEHYINKLLKEDPTLPFLKYIGKGVVKFKDLVEILKIKRNKDLKFLYKVLYEYYFDEKVKNNYELLDVDIHLMILPYMDGQSYYQVLLNDPLQNILKHLISIIRGLYVLYNNKILHNDLHANNIIITSDDKVKIFDWDRSFIEGVPNPLLSDDLCEFPCNKASCNIFKNNGFSIDFYKIMYYVFKVLNKKESKTVFNMLFKIPKIPNVSKKLFKTTIGAISLNAFFSYFNGDKECTYIYEKEFQGIQRYIGNIEEIYSKATGENPVMSSYSIQETIDIGNELLSYGSRLDDDVYDNIVRLLNNFESNSLRISELITLREILLTHLE